MLFYFCLWPLYKAVQRTIPDLSSQIRTFAQLMFQVTSVVCILFSKWLFPKQKHYITNDSDRYDQFWENPLIYSSRDFSFKVINNMLLLLSIHVLIGTFFLLFSFLFKILAYLLMMICDFLKTNLSGSHYLSITYRNQFVVILRKNTLWKWHCLNDFLIRFTLCK